MLLIVWLAVVYALASSALATAQEISGTPGSPSATTTIDGRYIPPPPQPFQGQIDKITIKLYPPKLSPEDIKRLRDAEMKMEANK